MMRRWRGGAPEMTKAEIRMTNQKAMTNDEWLEAPPLLTGTLFIRHCLFVILSSFGLRHSSFFVTMGFGIPSGPA